MVVVAMACSASHAADDLTLRVSSTDCVIVGDAWPVFVDVSSLVSAINGVQVVVAYDPQVLVPIDGSVGSAAGSPWNVALEVYEHDDGGRFVYAAVLPEVGTSADAIAATLTFNVIGAGVAQVWFAEPEAAMQTLLTRYPDSAAIVPVTHDSEFAPVSIAGDQDRDADVDFADFARLQICFTGPVGPVDPPAYADDVALCCNAADPDQDGDVDLDDVASLPAGGGEP